MGLGQTIQALAVIVHLQQAEGGKRFLVVAPASILGNWIREIRTRTALVPHLVHGPMRQRAFLVWLEHGGVAVASYETFRSDDFDGALARRNLGVDFLVVDEAHYIKNLDTARAQAVRELLPRAQRACFMTGTPLENQVGEFRNLVRMLKPEVELKLKALDPKINKTNFGRQRFHHAVAPVYLRRNQEDVLRELPEKIEKEEWIELTSEDKTAYRNAVYAKNMMAMRRTATIGAGDGRSAKLDRLDELLDEYRESEQKVLVFSFFLDVLAAVSRRFGVDAMITGALSPAARLLFVDEFQQSPGHALLLCQIQAGGVGLNIQAASAVVLMEPQWKASAEDQAIARAHRMGQTRKVIVHRLLAREAVDERLLEVLREKRALFDDYARESAVKEASEEAMETRLSRVIIEAELKRLREEEDSSDGSKKL
jgi:SNF2 family DNA or RNA helicase